jgi:hypothetical protein
MDKLAPKLNVVIKDGHGGIVVLYRCDKRTDLVDIFFEYSLKVHKYS